MKFLPFILVIAIEVFSINPFSYYWTINTGGDTATVTKWKNNNDSVLYWADRMCDTINTVIPRWSWFSNHDSTFKYMIIDTIGNSVLIDSINMNDGPISNIGYIEYNDASNYIIRLFNEANTGVYLNHITNQWVWRSGGTNIGYVDFTNGDIDVGGSATIDSGITVDGYGYFNDSVYIGRCLNIGNESIDDYFIAGDYGLTVGDTSESYSTIAMVADASNFISFGDTARGSGRYSGLIRYDHSGDQMSFNTGSTTRLTLGIDGGAFTGKIKADSITTNTLDYFTFNDTTFYDSLFVSNDYRTRALARITKYGDQITLYQPELTSTMSGTEDAEIRGIPADWHPVSLASFPIVAMEDSTYVPGYLEYDHFSLQKWFIITDSTFTFKAGTGGIVTTYITWIKE